MAAPFSDVERESLQVLDGKRRAAVARSAVRVGDLDALLQLPAKLKSVKAASSAPTKAEFDALVDDVTALFNRLQQIATVMQKTKL